MRKSFNQLLLSSLLSKESSVRFGCRPSPSFVFYAFRLSSVPKILIANLYICSRDNDSFLCLFHSLHFENCLPFLTPISRLMCCGQALYAYQVGMQHSFCSLIAGLCASGRSLQLGLQVAIPTVASLLGESCASSQGSRSVSHHTTTHYTGLA